MGVMICEGCGREVDRLVCHHWPQYISKWDAMKLGRFAEVCYRCNRALLSLFHYIGDVPWDFQKEALSQYYAFVSYALTLKRGSERRDAVGQLLQELDHGHCGDLEGVFSWLTLADERRYLVDKVLEVESKMGGELLTSRRFNVECGGGVYHGPHTKRHKKQVEAFLKRVGEEDKVCEWMKEHPEEVEKVRAKHGLT